MAKVYFIENTNENKLNECRPFQIQEEENLDECTSTYNEVLRILKDIFSLVDINQIIKKK